MTDEDATLDQTGDEAALAAPESYKESDDHVPNPLFVTGHVDTTGTGGDIAHIEEVSPVFAQARADALNSAVDALDNHPQGRPDSVILPSDTGKTYEEAADELRRGAEAAREQADLQAQGMTPARQEAAREGEPVNPNAIRADTHDLSVEGPTAPPTSSASGQSLDVGAASETGVPNVNPNEESLTAAQHGLDAPVVLSDTVQAEMTPGERVDPNTDGSNT